MPCGKESSPRIAIGRKLLTEEPSCEAEDMTAPEAFTTASKQPLTTGRRPDMTTGRRPDMTGICAKETAGFDADLASTCLRFGIKTPRDRLDLAKSIRECPPRLRSGAGRLVEQMLRQRCDTGRQSLPFVA